MKTIYNHHHRSRENVPQDYRKSVTERQIRRRRARIAQKAERRAVTHDSRAVKFHF